MHHKNILFIARTARHHERMRELSRSLDVSILLATPNSFAQAIACGHEFDLVIVDMMQLSNDMYSVIKEYTADKSKVSLLIIADDTLLTSFHLPAQSCSDFIVCSAGKAKFEVRMSRLLWGEKGLASSDMVVIDNMAINLATYQVHINDRPVDLTLMEYSLLSFLATHPGRAYSRETLLHRVWGFEYCGGTRTVDVHIRRVRSKVGLQIAAHIVTVRGVGYLFKL